MKKEQCPICYTELEVRECAPCFDCGHLPEEIERFHDNKHRYRIYNVHEGLQLQLCDFCDVDFGSYKTDYLGLPAGKRIGYENFEFIKEVENPEIEKDKYCPECHRRIKFLNFLQELREKNKK